MSATYVYCLVQSASEPRLPRLPRGLPHAGRPRLLELEMGLWLIVADAPEKHYGARAVERGLKDLDWVSRCALGHERIVEHFLGHAATVPFRLFTLFHDDARALARLRRRRAQLRQALAKVARCHEWGVRVQLDREVAVQKALATLAQATPGARERGRAFLERRRRMNVLRQSAWQRACERTLTACGRLGRIAIDARRRAPPAAATGALFDAAFLVPVKRSERFQAAAGETARRVGEWGCTLVLTGPWPPYSFVGPERSAPCNEETD